jgi:hypothetical protein
MLWPRPGAARRVPGDLKFTWQLDYGTFGEKRVTPTSAEPGREAAVSKNSGIYTVSYVRLSGPTWRFTADGGVEHKRVANEANPDRIDNPLSAIAAASIRNVGARLVGSDPDRAPEIAWSLQASLANAGAILPDAGEKRRFFADPVAVLWFSFWPRSLAATAGQEARLFYQLQLRGEIAGMRVLESDGAAEGHWDASLVYFFTPANGIMLRRFEGYFDHNLRDRKSATAINILWKFR